MSGPIKSGNIRVGVYGTGRFANRTHIPNLLKIDGVEIVALCDTDPSALSSTASRLPQANAYGDAHVMLRSEHLDVLYSCVPAYARSDVERTAAESGTCIFSEKPQALDMRVARDIDKAIRRAGVVGTVGFRERYRPIFQEARRFLAGKAVIHAQYVGYITLSPLTGEEQSWSHRMGLSGGVALDWGVHAVDCIRYMTGSNVEQAQAFYCQRPRYSLALSSSFNYRLSNGGTMAVIFVSALSPEANGPRSGFVIGYEGGWLELQLYDELKVDGEVVFRGEPSDPWSVHDRRFIEAVRTQDASGLANDYHDGLYSLAPVLAGWESSRRGGELIDVERFMSS